MHGITQSRVISLLGSKMFLMLEKIPVYRCEVLGGFNLRIERVEMRTITFPLFFIRIFFFKISKTQNIILLHRLFNSFYATRGKYSSIISIGKYSQQVQFFQNPCLIFPQISKKSYTIFPNPCIIFPKWYPVLFCILGNYSYICIMDNNHQHVQVPNKVD